MSWVLPLIVLVAGWWNTLDASASIIDGLYKYRKDPGLRGNKTRFKILMLARVVRGLFGLLMVVSAFFLVL